MCKFKRGDLIKLHPSWSGEGLDDRVFLVLDVRKGAGLEWRTGKREINLLLDLPNGSTQWILSGWARLVEEG